MEDEICNMGLFLPLPIEDKRTYGHMIETGYSYQKIAHHMTLLGLSVDCLLLSVDKSVIAFFIMRVSS